MRLSGGVNVDEVPAYQTQAADPAGEDARHGVTRRDVLGGAAALGLAAGRARRRARGRAARAADLGHPRLARADLVRSGRDAGHHHAVHGALRAARRDGQGHAGQAAGAVPGRVVVDLGGRPDARIRAAPRASSSTTASRSRPRTSSSRSSAITAPRTTLLKEKVAAVEIADPRRVRFKLKEPWPDFLTFYSTASGAGWIVPKKYVEKVGDEGFKKAPIGAGPYKFVSFNPGRRAGARSVRGLLAQDAERQAPGDEGDPRRGDARWRR